MAIKSFSSHNVHTIPLTSAHQASGLGLHPTDIKAQQVSRSALVNIFKVVTGAVCCLVGTVVVLGLSPLIGLTNWIVEGIRNSNASSGKAKLLATLEANTRAVKASRKNNPKASEIQLPQQVSAKPLKSVPSRWSLKRIAHISAGLFAIAAAASNGFSL